MTIEIAVVLVIIALAFVLFVTEVLPIDVTALAVLGLLLVGGFISPVGAISGFSNPAVITIAALFILSNALQKTGILEVVVIRINQLVQRSMVLGMAVYLLSIGLASAVVNNTAIVAIFMPVTIRLAQQYQISPSKVLIPLSYVAILGGTLTLVGTSTNLLVNSILIKDGGYPPLGMFEFSRFGVIILAVGLIYILAIGHRLLPSRTVTSSLTKSYHLGGYLTEIKLTPESNLVGTTCLKRGINQHYDVTILDIMRKGKPITSNIRNTVLQAGDVLFVRGSLENFLRMKEGEKVALLTDEKLTQQELEQDENILIECLLTDKSELVGKSLMEVNFRRRFGSFVLAIRREGAILRRKIAHVLLNAFDTLLVYGPREKIKDLAEGNDFIVMQEIEATLKKHRFWWLSIVVILTAVLLAALELVPILKGTLIGAILLLIFRVLTPNEAYRSIHWPVIVLIAAMIPLGQVIQDSGTASWIGSSILTLVGKLPEPSQPLFLLGLVYLITMTFTEVSSNAVTAIIMTPIVLAITVQTNMDPRPFIFAVCFAASASFVTPIGYQTNLMVYGPGGYKFSDYMKVGLPLAILLWVLAIIFIPIIWPFTPAQI